MWELKNLDTGETVIVSNYSSDWAKRFVATCDSGDQCWYKDKHLHMEDGPALVHAASGIKRWYVRGLSHRDGGPAVIYATGGAGVVQ